MLRIRGVVQLIRCSCGIFSRCNTRTRAELVRYLTSNRFISTSSSLHYAGKDSNTSSDLQEVIRQGGIDNITDTASIGPLGIQVYPEIFDRLPPKCPGCGSVFQSEIPHDPGYVVPGKIPQQVCGDVANDEDLAKQVVCQRCFSIQHYNKSLPVNVNNKHITEFLSHISRRKALIVYIVDMMDLLGSLYPQLLDIVGPAKRIIIVGNKIDMLPQDGRPWVQAERLKSAVLQLCKEHGLENSNIKAVCLMSAKEGFGIPELIRKIHEYWDQEGDVYLMGCSNTGKTTLFNTLMDLMNVHKERGKEHGNMLQRAIVSLWPGTTLGLLRFPLGHWMLAKLQYRLTKGMLKNGELVNDDEVAMDTEIIDRQETVYKVNTPYEIQHTNALTPIPAKDQAGTVDMYRPEFVKHQAKKHQSWFYDTPGIVSDNQITSYLTMQELKLLNPNYWLVPRTFILKPGQTLLIGGLARVDFVQINRKPLNEHENGENTDALTKANMSIFFTVFTSANLPIHVLDISKAEDFYCKHAGTELLKVPVGGKQRMESFPKLQSQDFSLTGIGWKESAVDVVLSNVGWVTVTAGVGSDVYLKAYTPHARGLGLRKPALLPTSVSQRGKRGVSYLGHLNPCAYESHRKRSPQLINSLGHGQHGVYEWLREVRKVKQQQLALLKERRMEKLIEKSLAHSTASALPAANDETRARRYNTHERPDKYDVQ